MSAACAYSTAGYSRLAQAWSAFPNLNKSRIRPLGFHDLTMSACSIASGFRSILTPAGRPWFIERSRTGI
jgi:hypothetical protein